MAGAPSTSCNVPLDVAAGPGLSSGLSLQVNHHYVLTLLSVLRWPKQCSQSIAEMTGLGVTHKLLQLSRTYVSEIRRWTLHTVHLRNLNLCSEPYAYMLLQ